MWHISWKFKLDVRSVTTVDSAKQKEQQRKYEEASEDFNQFIEKNLNDFDEVCLMFILFINIF